MTNSQAKLYDKTGAAYSFDHEQNGTLYVRPLVKVVMQSTNYHGDDFHEEVDFEPADYLVAKADGELFYAPPIEAVEAELVSKQAELSKMKADASKSLDAIRSEKQKAEWELSAAKRQLEEWVKTHRVMMDLGKLLDGKVLYPLSVRENSYHRSRSIPYIPEMRNVAYLAITSGNFERGQKWVVKRYADDNYGNPFMFFDTEEERAAEIQSEFDAACQSFRQKPDFTVDIYTTTNLHYGTLLKWVETHPALSIPDDIKTMKAENDAKLVEAKKARLAAELAALSPTTPS